MSGTVKVGDADQPAATQAAIHARGTAQVNADLATYFAVKDHAQRAKAP